MSTIPESEMRAPRLELRWEDIDGGVTTETGFYTCRCVYSLVLALGKYDIRAEREDDDGEPLPNLTEYKVTLGNTHSTGEAGRHYDAKNDAVSPPFRDGAHARWDSIQLGQLPVYAVSAGRAQRLPED